MWRPSFLVPSRGYVGAGGVYEGPEGNGYLLREAEGDLELPHAPPGAAGKLYCQGATSVLSRSV